jgi:hypothetical protein
MSREGDRKIMRAFEQKLHIVGHDGNSDLLREGVKRMLTIRLLLICLLLTLFAPLQTAEASPQTLDTPPQKQALLVLINRLSFDDLAAMPGLQALSRQGAVALMNINTGGKRTDANAYATMAAGVPARMEESAVLAYNADEHIHDVPVAAGPEGLYHALDHEVLLLSMPRIQQAEERWKFEASAVALGDALHRQGLRTAVLGSSDRGDMLWRPAVLFTSDAAGRTAYGKIGSGLFKSDPGRPYGVRTDYEKMWDEYLHLRGRASLIVFDLADLYRLGKYRHLLSEERFAQLRAQVLQEMARFLGRLAGETGPNRLLLIASPQVPVQAAENREWLSPVIAIGGGVKAETVLTSATTRREGIVSNLDIAPTLLHFLGVPKPRGMIGYPLQDTAALQPHRLGDLKAEAVWTYKHRTVVLSTVGALIGFGLLFAVLRLVFRVRTIVTPSEIRALLWTALAMPLCLYLLPVLRPQGLWEVACGLWALYLLTTAIPFQILPFCQKLTGRLVWLSAWTIAVVVFDTWQGGTLAKHGLLSYDPIVGARYYGVGNEYMGVVVGAAVLLYAALLHTKRVQSSWLGAFAVLGGLFLTAFFASPALGTNTGGALTMAGTTGLCFAMQKRYRLLPSLGVLLASLLCACGLLLLLNQPSAPPSHIGAAADQVLSGGLEELLHIFTRKSDMFVRLLFSSIWPAVLMLLFAVFAYALFVTPPKETGVWQARYPYYKTVVGGMLSGGVVGLFTNDSGIVVLGMVFLFALFPTLLIWLETETPPGRAPKRSLSLRRS